jgi:hypothetical protein
MGLLLLLALIRQCPGRVVEAAEPVAQRLSPMERIAPGAPPLLSFRLLDGRSKGRFGELDLVLDDAGH